MSSSDLETSMQIVFIWELFESRCVGLDGPCGNQAEHLSHIYPKSRGKISMDWKTQVLQCAECHNEYHRRGVNDEAIEKLLARRAEFLRDIGKENYV